MELVGRPDIPNPSSNYAKLCLPFVVGTYLARGRVDVPDFASPELRDQLIAPIADWEKVEDAALLPRLLAAPDAHASVQG